MKITPKHLEQMRQKRYANLAQDLLLAMESTDDFDTDETIGILRAALDLAELKLEMFLSGAEYSPAKLPLPSLIETPDLRMSKESAN